MYRDPDEPTSEIFRLSTPQMRERARLRELGQALDHHAGLSPTSIPDQARRQLAPAARQIAARFGGSIVTIITGVLILVFYGRWFQH